MNNNNNNNNNIISFPCIEITQPIGQFYVGVINSDDLIDIAYADIRRVEKRDVERYLGIQRPLSPKRVEELTHYVHNLDATFPTGVILAVDSDNANYDFSTKRMEIVRSQKVAKIIDGQHRLAGLENYEGETPFEVNVTIFIDMDIEYQAMVFATINLAQTKVNKSLVYDLYELTTKPSPQKTAHNIAKLFNSEQNSPFYGRIKLLGTATRKFQTLTQAAFVESLLQMISGDQLAAMKDRDTLLRGKRLQHASPAMEKQLIFRNMFIEGMDVEIADVLWNYFEAVATKWPNSWSGVDVPGNVLPRTNGFRALMRFLRIVYNYLGGSMRVPSKMEFMKVLNKLQIPDESFTAEQFLPGTSGEAGLFRILNDEFETQVLGEK